MLHNIGDSNVESNCGSNSLDDNEEEEEENTGDQMKRNEEEVNLKVEEKDCQ